MIRSLIRPSYRWGFLLCLALLSACGTKEPVKPAPELTKEQAASLRQQVEELRARTMELSSQIAEMRKAYSQDLSDLTTETQRLAASLNSIIVTQLHGKPVPLSIRPVSTAKNTTTDHAKGPIGPFARFLLIVVILGALFICARLFLTRLSEDEEDEDDELAPDEESPAETETLRATQTPAAAPAPEVKNPLESEPQPGNNEGVEHK